MTTITVAATQMACAEEREANVARAEAMVREAAGRGARIILLQELYETPYFPQSMNHALFSLAMPADGHPTLERMSALAAELEVVLPVSFFERANNAFYNSVAVIDADGGRLGLYRKSHIPHAPGYEEKYYFTPGDTGFRVWPTRYARIGIGICWDQWFPEAARCMALGGADILFYPTAIGNPPDTIEDSDTDSAPAWQRAMQGHAAANAVAVVASNRVGVERANGGAIDFYGSSFIADCRGAKLAEAGRREDDVIAAELDLDAMRAHRDSWSFFRDRRTDLYGPLMTNDGATRPG
jgi:N-carbamoylputrescine amidase